MKNDQIKEAFKKLGVIVLKLSLSILIGIYRLENLILFLFDIK